MSAPKGSGAPPTEEDESVPIARIVSQVRLFGSVRQLEVSFSCLSRALIRSRDFREGPFSFFPSSCGGGRGISYFVLNVV